MTSHRAPSFWKDLIGVAQLQDYKGMAAEIQQFWKVYGSDETKIKICDL